MNALTSESYVLKLDTEPIPVSDRQRHAISRRGFRNLVVVFEETTGFLACAAAVAVTYFLQLHIGHPVFCTGHRIAMICIAAGLFAVLPLQKNNVRSVCCIALRIQETERAIRMALQSLLLMLATGCALRLTFLHTAVAIGLVLIPLFLVAQKQMSGSFLRVLQAKGYGVERVVVYGAPEPGRRTVVALLSSVQFGLRPVAVIHDESNSSIDASSDREYESIPVQYGPVNSAGLQALQCDLLIVAKPYLSAGHRRKVIEVARRAEVQVAFLFDAATTGKQSVETIEIDGLVLESTARPTVSWHYVLGKRVVDLFVSSSLLLLLAPLLLCIALLIRLTSRGPAFFVQKRAGRHGVLFNMYKFRSMYQDAPKYEFSPTTSSDPRITPIGRFLRKASLDELPQLMNVFIGSMSLVGPRPEMPFIVEGYNSKHRQRLQVLPGITGLWQLSADRSYPIHENIRYDLDYIRARSLCIDFAILIHTLFFAMGAGV